MKHFFYILFLFSIFIFTGCLKDDILAPESIAINKTAVLLSKIETIGEKIISDPCPVLIQADTLFNKKANFLILDFRPKEDFLNGHIENAVNIESKNLLSYLSSIDTVMSKNIACVDADGQSSAYFAALLRLYGYQNSYSLNFGMASWNGYFADTWLQVIAKGKPFEQTYTDVVFYKKGLLELPSVSFPEGMTNYDEGVKSRISQLLQRGFVDTVKLYTDSLSTVNYVICYGNNSLYLSGEISSYPNMGHPSNVYYYSPLRDLLSSSNLQTLPPNKPILIYCYNGQLSAVTTAYLNLLGYQVRTLLYGADYLFHFRMIYDMFLLPYSFTERVIKSFPYVK